MRKFHFDEKSDGISGNAWHTDQSCAPIPPLGSILYMHTIPPNGGGDTLFVSMYAAYDALSDRMKTYLEGLTALHDGVLIFGDGTPRTEHPVVVRHPESGRKGLYFNGGACRWINGVPKGEGIALVPLPRRALPHAGILSSASAGSRTRSRSGTTAAAITTRPTTIGRTRAPAIACRSRALHPPWPPDAIACLRSGRQSKAV